MSPQDSSWSSSKLCMSAYYAVPRNHCTKRFPLEFQQDNVLRPVLRAI